MNVVCGYVKGLGSPRRSPGGVPAAVTHVAVPPVWFISAHLWYGCIEADFIFVFMPLGIFPGERKKKKQCKISNMRGHLLRSMQDSQQPCLGFSSSTPGSFATASSSLWPARSISSTNWHLSLLTNLLDNSCVLLLSPPILFLFHPKQVFLFVRRPLQGCLP